MAKPKVRGEAGAAKNFMTRNQALKKLQCTLADFRRLCILKGIFPREPRHKKRVNKGSSAPATFYYTKDITFLLHEPVLEKLREHKAFAKKISRALGRGEWDSAKTLEESKPMYKLDHIIKERYPTFVDSLKDLSDALCLLALFSFLPANTSVSSKIIENCSRLYSEWQLYIIRTRSLRKVFLSIKGIYFEAQINGIDVRWLVPYLFTQNVPDDIDFRIMMTFLDLYQTMMGFVLFKLYQDINLVYPPPCDTQKAADGAGFEAFELSGVDSATSTAEKGAKAITNASGQTIKPKDVKIAIKALGRTATSEIEGENALTSSQVVDLSLRTEADDEVFEGHSELPTLSLIESQALANTAFTSIFSGCTFFLSREVPRSTFEFIIKSFGGAVGWTETAGIGSKFAEDDERITHCVIDRPMVARPVKGRCYVQPQWIVDCINARKVLPAHPYAPGELLPPHLSPFVDDRAVALAGGYVPEESNVADQKDVSEEESEDEEDGDEASDAESTEATTTTAGPALLAAAADPTPSKLHAAEVEAESMGLEMHAFQSLLAKHTKQAQVSGGGSKRKAPEQDDAELAKIMMSNKQRKLYEKMKYGQGKKATEKAILTERKKALTKEQKKK